MLTSITEKDTKRIKVFIKQIDKGPFKYLNDKKCSSPQSEYIVKATKKFKSIYQCAVAQAWLDVCRRVEVNEYTKSKIEAGKKTIINGLQKYFAGKPKNEDAFEGWYDSLLSISTKNTALTVGQAQKIINMSFKYLFCCEDIRESKMSHFTWCHMPLDKVTLDWLGMNGLAWTRIDDLELYSMIIDFARLKTGGNLLLKDFEVWKPVKK